MSFSSRHTITRKQNLRAAAARKRGDIDRHGSGQHPGEHPHATLPAEPGFRPIKIAVAPAAAGPEGRMLICRLCGGAVLAGIARAHIGRCWGVSLGPDEPIPMLPTRAAVLRWIRARKAGEGNPSLGAPVKERVAVVGLVEAKQCP